MFRVGSSSAGSNVYKGRKDLILLGNRLRVQVGLEEVTKKQKGYGNGLRALKRVPTFGTDS